MNKLYLVSVLVLLSILGYAQNVPPTQFGLQTRVIVPSKFIDGDDLLLNEDRLQVEVGQAPAISFGMLLRQTLTETFTLETGINYTRRRFNMSLSDRDSTIKHDFTLRLVTYEVPIQALLYVRTGRQSYINTAAGFVFDFFPSDLKKTGPDFEHFFLTEKWVKGALSATVGFEYRTDNSGSWYIGAGYHRPFGDLGTAAFRYHPQSGTIVTSGRPEGSFLSVDVRYFFSE